MSPGGCQEWLQPNLRCREAQQVIWRLLRLQTADLAPFSVRAADLTPFSARTADLVPFSARTADLAPFSARTADLASLARSVDISSQPAPVSLC